MEVQIRINGVPLDGVAPGAVKLTINNPDPIKFSDRTVSYSGSITVPRSQANDRVLKSERFPGHYTRTAPYVAELSFSGLDVPFGGGLFRARVSADPDSYTVELIETVSKLSTLRAPVVNIPTYESPAYRFSRYADSLDYAYPAPVSMPGMDATDGMTPVELAYVADRETRTAGDYTDAESQLVFKGAHDGLRGSVYAANYMIAENNDVATCFAYMTGSTFDLEFTPDSFVILPPAAPATVYLRSNGGTSALPFARGTVRPDGNYPYRPAGSGPTTFTITPRQARDLNFGFTTSPNSMVYSGTPVTSVPTTEAYYISFHIKRAGTPAYAQDLVPTMGLDTPFDIVQAFCKAFCWTYEFQSSPFSLTLKPFVNPSASPEYRQNWTGKIDMGTVRVSEAAGAARTYAVKVGELTQTVGGYGGAISTQETAGESSFPVNPGAHRPYATMIRKVGSYWGLDNYFNRASGYRATIAGHYERFSPGWQVTARMRLTYFDIKNMKPDGLYYIDELDAWFYLRTVGNWDASTGTANVTLIAVNN